MGNVNMEAYQIRCGGKSVAEKLVELDVLAQQVGGLPTFTSDDREFLEEVPPFPTEEGEKYLKATTDEQGNTGLSYSPITIPEGFTVRTKKYTGTGTVSIEHDFGTETPKVIFAISIDPEFNNANADFATINGFPWGSKMTSMDWSVGSNNVPNVSGNGGSWRIGLAYNGNKLKVTARDAGAACNRNGTEYVIWYVV